MTNQYIPAKGFVPLDAAAAVLRRVAHEGEVFGRFPSDVTLYEVGRALHCFCSYAPEPQPLLAYIFNGWYGREADPTE